MSDSHIPAYAYYKLDEVVTEIIDRRGVTPIKLGGDFTTYGHRVFSAKNIKDGRIDLSVDEPRFVDTVLYSKWMKSPLLFDDVVLTSEAPLGEVAYISNDVDWVLGQRLFAIRSKKDILYGKYLYYLLQTKNVKDEILNRATGTTVTGIRQSELRLITIPLPPLPMQQRIADILGALDDKIELNRRMNATLEAMARALFKSWFVDFDPVHAKAAGQPTGLPAHIDALFPSAFVDSPLGQIPQGWGVQAVNQIININPSTSLRAGTLAPFVSMNMLPTSGYSITDRVYDKYVGGTKFINGDVLLARITPSLENGKTAIIDFLNDGQVGFGSTEFIIMREKDAIKTPFIACLARLESFRDHCIQSMTGSTGRQRVDNSCFDNFLMAIPNSNEVLHQFSLQTSTYFRQISHNTEQIRTLTALRDTLLPKLLSGEVDV